MSDLESNSTVDCPVCSQSFSGKYIEDHVEACLLLQENDSVGAAPLSPTMNSTKKIRLDSQSAQPLAKNNSKEMTSSEGSKTMGTSTSTKMFAVFSPHNSLTATKKRLINEPTTPHQPAAKQSLTDIDSQQITKTSLAGKPVQEVNSKPLADQMRPQTLDDFIGQNHILSQESMLCRLIESNMLPSMILWGPPGCGKTSLAHIIAAKCRASIEWSFVALSATTCGVTDVKDVVKRAKNDKLFVKRKTVLFIDEIHRFNKLQQDTFLPHVENGTITLIGATTENPSYSLNSALLSRCRVFVLEKLHVDHVMKILERAAQRLNTECIESASTIVGICESENPTKRFIEVSALKSMAELSDGDARVALNCLGMMASQCDAASLEGRSEPFVIKLEHVQEAIKRSTLLYDRKGDEHYNCISALHKSMRGSDSNAALYWLGRILEGGEDPRYVSRRLIRFASEDIGLADPMALNQAVAAHDACQYIGMPECDVVLAQCVIYLSMAPKSVLVYEAYRRVKEAIASHKGPQPPVPIHLRNANTKLDRALGYGKDYIYNPHHTGPINQTYLPDDLTGCQFLDPIDKQ